MMIKFKRPKAKFKKGDRIRMTKKAKHWFRNTPAVIDRHGGVGEVTGPTTPDGSVPVRFLNHRGSSSFPRWHFAVIDQKSLEKVR